MGVKNLSNGSLGFLDGYRGLFGKAHKDSFEVCLAAVVSVSLGSCGRGETQYSIRSRNIELVLLGLCTINPAPRQRLKCLSRLDFNSA